MKKVFNFVKQSKEELKKVTWPNKQKTFNYTLAVIAISIAVAAFLGILDMFFSTIMEKFVI